MNQRYQLANDAPRRLAKAGRRLVLAAAAGMLALAPTASFAGATMIYRLSLNVPIFCNISAPEHDVVSLDDHGSASLGMIHEICNTPSGYDVTTQFTNLNGGNLDVDNQVLPVQSDGSVVRTSDEARSQTLAWNLTDAKVVAGGQPVLIHVTITPR